MKKIIKMIFYRIKHNKAYLFFPIVVTPIIIALSINFTQNMTSSINIAIVGCSDISLHQSDGINISYLDVKPPFSEVMDGKYDAVITTENGNYSIETIKGSTVKNAIEDMLQGKSPSFDTSFATRGEISNLTGFIMMFVLSTGVMLYKFYYEEKGGLEMRILSSPISNTKYILSHVLTVFLTIFIPIIIITSTYEIIWGFDTNISVLEISSIIFLMSLLGSTLGLFISSIINSDENAVLVGTMTVICTTLLSGSFKEIASNNVTKFISSLLPQKYILDYAISLENNKSVNLMGVLYVIILSFAFVLLSLYFNKRRLINSK